MPVAEVQEVSRSVPFFVDSDLVESDGGSGYTILRWLAASGNVAPPYWSMQRDKWLRQFVYQNGPMKTAVSTFVNKLVTIPWSIQARDRSISRHVLSAETIEKSLRRVSGSMSSGPLRGFKNTLKMFVKDYLTQDNGAFAVILGEGRADGPIVGAPTGLLHLDAALCTRTRDEEFPVKYLNAGRGGDSKEYKIHYTRIIEMCNLPSAEIDLNGVGLCAVSCCIEAAQELADIYRYNQEMFGSRPPRQILYAKSGATVKTMMDAVYAWQAKLDRENQTHFGGTLIMAPRNIGQTMELGVVDMNRMPEDFNRRDVTTIDKSEIAAAFGLDLRDLAYTMGAPSRTGDAEVQDRKGRGKGIGEFIETFKERMEQAFLNGDLFALEFDNLDDEQDEQEANIRDRRSAGRERDLRAAITTIRVERERMWSDHEITYEQFAEMELEDGRLPEGLDVLLLFQSEDKDYKEWLDIGVSDPTNIAENDPQKMADTIHERYIELSRLIHEETRVERRRKARQALAALDKLRSMYQVPEGQAITDAATVEAMDEGAAAGTDPATTAPAAQTPAKKPATDKPDAKATKEVHADFDTLRTLHGASGERVDGASLRTKQLAADDPDIYQYEQRFAHLLDQAYEGAISRERFEGALEQIVIAVLLTLFSRGAFMAYVEFTEEMRALINEQVEIHLRSLDNFADSIYSPEPPSKGQSLLRMGTWMTIASGVYYLGQLYRRDNPHLRWNYSVFKEHCEDCARLNGQVHTAAEWRAAGFWPRSTVLQCFGVYCGCFFTEVPGPSAGAF